MDKRTFFQSQLWLALCLSTQSSCYSTGLCEDDGERSIELATFDRTLDGMLVPLPEAIDQLIGQRTAAVAAGSHLNATSVASVLEDGGVSMFTNIQLTSDEGKLAVSAHDKGESCRVDQRVTVNVSFSARFEAEGSEVLAGAGDMILDLYLDGPAALFEIELSDAFLDGVGAQRPDPQLYPNTMLGLTTTLLYCENDPPRVLASIWACEEVQGDCIDVATIVTEHPL